MIPKETFLKILDAGVQAPSGENCQPWRFSIDEAAGEIRVFNIPERDQSLYNFKQRGSFFAHGCLLENIKIAASALGYNANIGLFPEAGNQDLVACVYFQEASPAEEALYPLIAQRATNRKAYQKIPLATEQKSRLLNVQQSMTGASIRFEEDPSKIKTLIEATSANEKVLFNNKFLHHFFFEHLTWTKEQYEKRLTGFYIKTLEIPAPAQKMLKLFQHWPAMKFFSKLGANNAIAKTNVAQYSACSAVGVILIPSDASKDFVLAGMVMEQLWLEAVQMKLSIQPLVGAISLAYRILSGDAKDFSPAQATLLTDSYKNVKDIFGIQNETIAMIFRIGSDGDPSATSKKMPAVIEA